VTSQRDVDSPRSHSSSPTGYSPLANANNVLIPIVRPSLGDTDRDAIGFKYLRACADRR
jgi:hypothetical protein